MGLKKLYEDGNYQKLHCNKCDKEIGSQCIQDTTPGNRQGRMFEIDHKTINQEFVLRRSSILIALELNSDVALICINCKTIIAREDEKIGWVD